MKMRLISLALVVMMVGIALTGCTTTTVAATNNPFLGRFVKFNTDFSNTVIVDKETGVCYLWHRFEGMGGLTVMFDEDGYPVTCSEVKYAAD